MLEDKLTRDERIRLEALAQAVHLSFGVTHRVTSLIITQAKDFEKYIRGEEEDATAG
jgi:hypothetical protein